MQLKNESAQVPIASAMLTSFSQLVDSGMDLDSTQLLLTSTVLESTVAEAANNNSVSNNISLATC